MVFIFLTIMGIFSILFIKPTWNSKWRFSFICNFLIITLFTFLVINYLSQNSDIIEKGGISFIDFIPWLDICLYFMMIAGMIAKYIFDWISEVEKNRQTVFSKLQLMKPMLISPIVFASVYSSMGKIESTLLLFIFSFQNGFFWQTIFNNRNQDITN